MQKLSPCIIERANFRGWDAVYLGNGIATIVAVPSIGGRIMAFDLGDYPFFFVDPTLAGKLFTPEENQGDGSMADWKNFGGDKTWPSPQGWENEDQWHGPPDPVLGSGVYTIVEMENNGRTASVQMVSPPDMRTGMQITRKVILYQGSARATLQLNFKNISKQARRWSIWDVTQLRAEKNLANGDLAHETRCTVTAPLNPHSRFPQGFWVMFGAQDNPQWNVDRNQGLVVVNYAWEIGKIGSDVCTPDEQSGWVAFSNIAQGFAFTERFPIFPEEEYPDDGSTVEVWTVGKGKVSNLDYEHSKIFLMETEVLSPFYTFQPGQSHSFQIEWGVCRTAGRIVDVQTGGCASQKLSAETTTGEIRLTGSFGVFDAGKLLLTWLNTAGELVGSTVLREVHPNRLVSLDERLQPSAESRSAELTVIAEADGVQRRLGQCNLKENV